GAHLGIVGEQLFCRPVGIKNAGAESGQLLGDQRFAAGDSADDADGLHVVQGSHSAQLSPDLTSTFSGTRIGRTVAISVRTSSAICFNSLSGTSKTSSS